MNDFDNLILNGPPELGELNGLFDAIKKAASTVTKVVTLPARTVLRTVKKVASDPLGKKVLIGAGVAAAAIAAAPLLPAAGAGALALGGKVAGAAKAIAGSSAIKNLVTSKLSSGKTTKQVKAEWVDSQAYKAAAADAITGQAFTELYAMYKQKGYDDATAHRLAAQEAPAVAQHAIDQQKKKDGGAPAWLVPALGAGALLFFI